MAKTNFSSNRKYKVNRGKKILITVGLTAAILSGTFVTGVGAMVYSTSHSSKPASYSYSQTVNHDASYVDAEKEYLEIDFSNEKEATTMQYNGTKIDLSDYDKKELIEKLNEFGYDFDYDDYYGLDQVFNKYHSTDHNKEKDTSLVTGNKIDANKLYNSIKHNNEIAKQDKVNAINTFYTDADDSDIKYVCKLIEDESIKRSGTYDINELSDTLSNLKMFKHDTSSAFAYVSDSFVLAYNPRMIGMYENLGDITGNNSYDNVHLKTLIHEIEHMFQHVSNDFNEENGLEIGFCRKYDDVDVNSLYISWLLEAAAEESMTEDLNVGAMNYAKKISYVKSYDLSRLFDDDYNVDDFKNAAFRTNIESVYKKLNLNTKKEQEDFMKWLYSIEITQVDCDDFWNYYQSKTGHTLTNEEHTAIRMDIRQEAVNYLCKNFYTGLVKSIGTSKVKDINTLFYFLRMWELDTCGHLAYTRTDSYDHAIDTLNIIDTMNNEIFGKVSLATGYSTDDIKDMYNEYKMNINDNGTIKSNADFNGFNDDKKLFINEISKSYSTTRFAKVNVVVNYKNKIK